MAKKQMNREDGEGNVSERSKRKTKLKSWFAEEIKDTRDGFNNHMRQWDREREERMSKRASWLYSPSSIIIGAILCIVLLLFTIAVLDIAAAFTNYQFLSAVSEFLVNNIVLFVGASLFFGVGRYVTYMSRESRLLLRPIFFSAGLIFAIWMIFSIVDLSVFLSSNLEISVLSTFFFANFGGIFVALLVIGYAITILDVFFLYLFW